jgi:hypothetical protein
MSRVRRTAVDCVVEYVRVRVGGEVDSVGIIRVRSAPPRMVLLMIFIGELIAYMAVEVTVPYPALMSLLTRK